MNKLIGLYSHSPGQGKTTVAVTLRRHHGYRIMPFAAPIKNVLTEFLGENGFGLDEKKAGDLVYDPLLKDTVIPALGVTPRYLMQTLGTEWGRKLICPDVWVNSWASRVAHANAWDGRVVADDVRFPNEVDRIRVLGGEIWRIVRTGHEIDSVELATAHESEGALAGITPDRVIVNSGTVEDLATLISRL